MGITLSSNALNEAHWVRVHRASFDRAGKFITVDVENLAPDIGSPADNGGLVGPSNLTVNLTFDLTRIGLPPSGAYTVERVGKDAVSLTTSFITPANGSLSVPVPQGAHMLRITAGSQPPAMVTLTLGQDINGYRGVQDTYIDFWAQQVNYGASGELVIHHENKASYHKALIRYDLTAVPAGAHVRFAVLNFRLTRYPGHDMPATVYTLNRAWRESEATYLLARAGTAWGLPGGEAVPGDRSGDFADTRRIGPLPKVDPPLFTPRYGMDVTASVQRWLGDSTSNNGFLLRSAPPAWDSASAWHDEFGIGSANGNTYYRPELTLMYTLQESTPTPTNTPTNTPTPTTTPTPTATPTPTNTPTATSTPAVGQIVGEIFMDLDRNGVREPGESGVQGIRMRLQQDDQIQADVFSGDQGRFQFDSVPPGMWQVQANLPADFDVTSNGGNPISVAISGGDVGTASFGVALKLTSTPTPTATPTATSTSTSTRVPRNNYLPLMMGYEAH